MDFYEKEYSPDLQKLLDQKASWLYNCPEDTFYGESETEILCKDVYNLIAELPIYHYETTIGEYAFIIKNVNPETLKGLKYTYLYPENIIKPKDAGRLEPYSKLGWVVIAKNFGIEPATLTPYAVELTKQFGAGTFRKSVEILRTGRSIEQLTKGMYGIDSEIINSINEPDVTYIQP